MIHPLPQDYDPPAADPDDVSTSTPFDEPATDSDVDQHERYDEGLRNTTEAQIYDDSVDEAGTPDTDSSTSRFRAM